jgi:hypothetical protein
MVYGSPLTLPGEFLEDSSPPSASFLQELREKMSGFQPPDVKRPTFSPVLESSDGLREAELVYVRRGGVLKPLSPLYEGPYRVLEKSQKYFRLDIGGQAEAVSVDRLKPHLGPSNVAPALPTKRGRPSNAGGAGVGGRGRPPEVAASSRS